MEIYPQMEVVFVKRVFVEFTKRLPRGKLEVVLNGTKLGLDDKGGIYKWEDAISEIVLDEEKEKLKVEIV